MLLPVIWIEYHLLLFSIPVCFKWCYFQLKYYFLFVDVVVDLWCVQFWRWVKVHGVLFCFVLSLIEGRMLLSDFVSVLQFIKTKFVFQGFLFQWLELSWIELNWVESNRIELNWISYVCQKPPLWSPPTHRKHGYLRNHLVTMIGNSSWLIKPTPNNSMTL